MRTILVTGGAGFIGTNFVRYVLSRQADVRMIAFDKLTYAGNLSNLGEFLDDPRFAFIRGDVCDAPAVRRMFDEYVVSDVVHFAAESHVDRSIMASAAFVMTNVVGTQVLADVSRARGVARYIQVSTDEVYGALPLDRPDLKFSEESTLAPNSPYSATKASADTLIRSYVKTYRFPGIITRCCNNYGPYQFPEKVVPLFVTNLLEGRRVPLYGDGKQVREWIHVEDHCDALWQVLERGRVGEVYNIGGPDELTNLELTQRILREMGREWDASVQFVRDRPGHDARYAIDDRKLLTELGWRPRWSFEEGLRQTVRWYQENEPWWRAVKSGEYREFYRKWYEEREAGGADA